MTTNTDTTAASGAASPLTDDQIKAIHHDLCTTTGANYLSIARAVEAAHGVTTAAPAAQEAEPAWLTEVTDRLKALAALKKRSDSMPVMHEIQWLTSLRNRMTAAPRPQADAGAPETPEGCTPADAQILRRANHDLAAESFELQQALRGIVAQAGGALARFDIAAAPQAPAAPTAAACAYAPLPKPYSAAAALGLDDLYTGDDMRAHADAHRAAPAPAAGAVPTDAAGIATTVCRQVAELPDRNSPEDWPEAMLVTADELHMIVREALGAAAPAQEAEDGWMPIETAPRDGRVLLLGYYNAHGMWRTLRGEWVSEDQIAEYWEVDAEPGWYETSVEAEDPPNAWPTNPTHWRLLPVPPAARARQEGGS